MIRYITKPFPRTVVIDKIPPTAQNQTPGFILILKCDGFKVVNMESSKRNCRYLLWKEENKLSQNRDAVTKPIRSQCLWRFAQYKLSLAWALKNCKTDAEYIN